MKSQSSEVTYTFCSWLIHTFAFQTYLFIREWYQ